MNITSSQIDIFILTYNRASILAQTLQSLANQTIQNLSITILDSGSTDSTSQIIKNYHNLNITFKTSTKHPLSQHQNFQRAIKLAKAPYTILLHDDDLLPPNYIKNILFILNKHSNLSLITSFMTYETLPTLNWKKTHLKYKINNSATDLASQIYFGAPIHFGSAVYKTSLLKRHPWEKSIYGKILDIPLLLKIAETAQNAVIITPKIKYRHHPNQDLQNPQTAPTTSQFMALQKNYYQYLGDSIFTKSGLIFLYRNYQRLKLNHSWLNQSETISWQEYLKLALSQNATSSHAIFIGRIFYYLIKIIKIILRKT